MGIGYQGLNVLFSLWSEGKFQDSRSVLEIGAQDLKLPETELDLAVAMITGKTGVHTRDPQGGKTQYKPHLFYQALGFTDYKCIDADGTNNALVLDLNKDVRAQGMTQTFDLVTNFGTTEHCFDQHHAFQNIHALCKKDGIMVHDVPFQGLVNHGLFNYQPNFFLDLARANEYDLLGIYLNFNEAIGNLTTYSDELMQHIHIPPGASLSLLVALQKTTDAEFRTPYDSKYIGASKFKDAYGIRKLPKLYLPLNLPQIGETLPFRTLVSVLAARVKRKIRSYF